MQKVAHIVGSLHVGGAERFVIDLCSVQKKSNMMPEVISLGNPSEPLVKECLKENIPVICYGNNSLIKLFRVLIALHKFDVIHFHSPHALKFLSYILPLLNKKIIYTRHGAGALSEHTWKLMHKKAKRYIDIVTCVSQEGLVVFQQNHGWKDKPSYIIDNGVLIKSSFTAIQESKKLRIGSVGRMISLKNQLSLLQAVDLLPEDIQCEIEVHFFGDGECLKQLKTYAEQNLPKMAVHFNGMVNDRNLIYSSFDLLVVTSETEGLSMVIIEAMVNKIPVIATNVGGNPKLVIPDETGWLFEYEDKKKLAEYIENIVVDKAVLTPLGQAAFSFISENFSIETSAKKYAALYAN